MAGVKRSSIVLVCGLLLTSFAAGAQAGGSGWQTLKNWGHDQWVSATAARPATPVTVPAQGTIEVAFSPPGGATAAIVQAVGEAKQRVWVQ
ncbi:phospholipase D family protein, partial [Acidithiobacillus ferridurans]|nr:phospholipase D family protein [Acidithiobacillus ferridurans]